MADFVTAYAPLAKHEGGWSNNPADRGGETYAGISREFFPSWSGWAAIDGAKAHPSFGRGPAAFSAYLATLPTLHGSVTEWYHAYWWRPLGLGNLPQKLANEIFEQTVNLGKDGAGRYIQRMCNAFNRDKKTGRPLFIDLVVDGAIGPRTIAALSILLEKRAGEKALVHALNCLQGTHYINLASQNPGQRQFTDGWMTRTHDPE